MIKDEDIAEEMELGTRICAQIKKIYYANDSWQSCHQEISKKFSTLKNILKKFYSTEETTGNSGTLELLKKIQKFDTTDYQDTFDMESIITENIVKNDKPKYGDKVTWVPISIDNPELITQIKKILAMEREKQNVLRET